MNASSRRDLRVLFRLAAGPRIGYGHLVRATVLAGAMKTPAVVSLRGNAVARKTAGRLGCQVRGGSARVLLAALHPDLVVIDDPSEHAATAWCLVARSEGIPVASVHDLGIGYCGADLTIDGSVTRPAGRPTGPALLGPRYAIVAPRADHAARRSRTVLVALGGGPRHGVALGIARAIRHACPDVTVRVASGHAPASARPVINGVEWLGPQRGLGDELARASIAVVGGGVTLYEACREGTPAVAIAVVPAQRPTIHAFARAGAVLDAGPTAPPARTARVVETLLNDAVLRRRIGRTARLMIDGRGANRVAQVLAKLARPPVGSRRGGCA